MVWGRERQNFMRMDLVNKQHEQYLRKLNILKSINTVTTTLQPDSKLNLVRIAFGKKTVEQVPVKKVILSTGKTIEHGRNKKNEDEKEEEGTKKEKGNGA